MKKILIVYLLYALISGILVFNLPKDVSESFKETFDPKDFYGEKEGDDKVIIFDNPLESGLARLYLFEKAQTSIDVAYFSVEKGETSNVFYGALFDAADRGVRVNILLDGMFHGLRFNKRSIIYAIANHPNMTLKFYEKFNPLKPWTLNNRMHDKYIIIDNAYALIGGRNIGDKYFAPEWYDDAITNDRDAFIYNDKNSNSVINEMKEYFEKIWSHKYTKEVLPLTKRLFKKKADKKTLDLKRKAKLAKETYREQFDTVPDLEEIASSTYKISFIHNPLERFNKEPWVWYQLLELSKSVKDTIFIQSPYTITTKKMLHNFIDEEDFKDKKITLLTNSLASTPNLPAYSGYLNYRKKMVDAGIDVLEIQSKDSLHSKAFVYDQQMVAIGSFNVDPRSAFLSTESMVVIHSEEAVNKFGLKIHEYTDDSLLVDENYQYKKNPKIEAIKVPFHKKLSYTITSYLMKLLENLL